MSFIFFLGICSKRYSSITFFMVLVKKSKAKEIIVGLCEKDGLGIYQKQTREGKKKAATKSKSPT